MPTRPVADYSVELPSGGTLHLQTPDEVDLWRSSLGRYLDEYVFQKQNDLVTLGTLLQQQIVLYRAQVAINGMEPEVDGSGVPTGQYKRVEIDGADLAGYQKVLTEAAKEMRALEKSLGIDKATREAGGQHTVENYIKMLKQAAHDRGVHIVEMVMEYQRVMKELDWKLRLLYGGDAQDRAYHNVSPKAVLDWLRDEIAKLNDKDQEWANQVGRLYVGKL